MKNFFIKNVLTSNVDEEVTLLCWVVKVRSQKQRVFIDVADSTGQVQIIIEDTCPDFEMAKHIVPESSIEVMGIIQINPRKMVQEIVAKSIGVIHMASLPISPRPRLLDNPFDESLVEYQMNNRHIYQRNPKRMAVMTFRSKLMRILNDWLFENEFTEIHTPILTTVPLYEDRSVLGLDFGGNPAYLSQCAGFYLESCVHGLERIYNIGPSFRGETSKSRRHLAEYWHVKMEVAWVTREDLLDFVEQTMYNIIKRCKTDCFREAEILGIEFPEYAANIPYPRISYREAIARLQKDGYDCEFGRGLGDQAEDYLTTLFDSPFWLTSIPRKIEPFPYVIDKSDPECTMTADLIVPHGYGELLGVAEKISDPVELEERMTEKGKNLDPRYKWVKELRDYGSVPHGGIGMGFERLIRWLISLPHVREAIAFPRLLHRGIYP